LIPVEHSKLFGQTIENSVLEIVEDAGHAPVCRETRHF
jgi:2-hydroxy-6-oxonona-2,4-dienedioate hydrolase